MFTAMFELWNTHTIYCHENGKPQGELPKSVHNELKRICNNAMRSEERHIQNLLDARIKQHHLSKNVQLPLVWACLWQLLLMYRQILVGPVTVVGQTTQEFQDASQRMFKGLIVLYMSYFKMPGKHNLTSDLSMISEELHEVFKELESQRLPFCVYCYSLFVPMAI
jgi:hypothetical protein